MRIRYAAYSHRGRVRQNNEDNFFVQSVYRADVGKEECRTSGRARPGAFLAAVCDGMGGEAAGETASLLAVRALRPHVFAELPEAALEDIHEANRRICAFIRTNGGRRSGSTIAALYADKGMAWALNVGDSRIYRFRDGELRQLSCDHSQAQSMVNSGLLTAKQARSAPDRHVLLQYLGIFDEEMVIQPWVVPSIPLVRGDRFLLCSDGLTDMLLDEEIAKIMDREKNVSRTAMKLVQEALSSGGRDNITAVILGIG